MKSSKYKVLKKLSLPAFIVLAWGTYNSYVINSDQLFNKQSVKYVKRLDEINGLTQPGRVVANVGNWVNLSQLNKMNQKRSISLANKLTKNERVSSVTAKTQDTSENVNTEAAITTDLNLGLSDVFNAQKFPQGVRPTSFQGELEVANGLIETLNISVDGLGSLSLSSVPMSGNVFEYRHSDGETYSAMIYQSDATNYMITFTNGPLEGTRARFSTPKNESDTEVEVADNREVQDNTLPQQAQVESNQVAQFGSNDQISGQTPWNAQNTNTDSAQIDFSGGSSSGFNFGGENTSL